MNPAQEVWKRAIAEEAANMAQRDGKLIGLLPEKDQQEYLTNAEEKLREYLAGQGMV